MMKSGMVALALVGCDCDAKLCEYVGAAPGEWATVAECEGALKARVVEQQEAYPLVIGICRAADAPQAATAAAEASGVVEPLLDRNATGRPDTDASGRAVTVFRPYGAYVAVRDTATGVWSTAAGAATSASRRALDTVAWLKADLVDGLF